MLAMACFFATGVFAQNKLKVGVVVAGDGNAAVAAALQSAMSNVKTVLFLPTKSFGITEVSKVLPSGIVAEYQKKLSQQKIQPTDQAAVYKLFKRWTDSLRNLTVITDVRFEKASRSGKHWSFKLDNGITVQPKVLVNADDRLYSLLELSGPKTQWQKWDYGPHQYRTSIVAGKGNMQFLPLMGVLDTNQQNYLSVNDKTDMLAGQALGAVGAYAAFFNVSTSKANLKKIQGELLAFHANLVPFTDVNPVDSNWKAIQLVAVTGMLKGTIKSDSLYFEPDKTVTTAEIKQPMKDFFYKAQIFFDDFTSPSLTIADAIKMVAYIGNKVPETVTKELEKRWKSNYNFTSAFDLKRTVNRRELAVILQEYLPPFNVLVDLDGNVTR